VADADKPEEHAGHTDGDERTAAGAGRNVHAPNREKRTDAGDAKTLT